MKTKPFLYRINETDKRGRKQQHLAEVYADCDENARRKIIHTALAEGGTVQKILIAENASRLPGETVKRTY